MVCEVGSGEGGEDLLSHVRMSGQDVRYQTGELGLGQSSQSQAGDEMVRQSRRQSESLVDRRPPQFVRRGRVEAGDDGAPLTPAWRTVLQSQSLPGRRPGGRQQQPGGGHRLAGALHPHWGAGHVRAVDQRDAPSTSGLDDLLVLGESRAGAELGVGREHDPLSDVHWRDVVPGSLHHHISLSLNDAGWWSRLVQPASHLSCPAWSFGGKCWAREDQSESSIEMTGTGHQMLEPCCNAVLDNTTQSDIRHLTNINIRN